MGKGKSGKNIHKAMRNLVYLHPAKKRFSVTIKPKMHVIWDFADNLWLPFLDQTQSDTVVFEIFNFQIYITIFARLKHGIDPNFIILFN